VKDQQIAKYILFNKKNMKKILKLAFVKNCKIKVVAYIGLTISFTTLLFGISFYRTETSYDAFHTNANRLYRLTLKTETGLEDAQVGVMPREKFLKDIPEIEDIVRLHLLHKPVVICKNQVFTNESLFTVDSSFFEVFSFPLKRGNYNTLYEQPNSIILTSEFAIRLFGNDNVLGETLELSMTNRSGAELYYVSGILQDFPPNSHIKAGAIIFRPIEPFLYYTYLLLHKEIPKKDVEKKFDNIFKTRNIASLQSIKEIHLYSNKVHEIKNNGNISSLRIMVISCLLVFIISVCNYIIISWISNVKDIKTIHLKRIVGANFPRLLLNEISIQFVGILSFVFIGIAFFYFVNHNVSISKEFIADLIILILIFICVVIIATCIPFMLIYYKLQNTNIVWQSNSSIIAILAIFQLTIAIGLITASFLITHQMNFIYRNQLGGTETNLLVLNDLTWDEMGIYESLKQELPKNPSVLGICSAQGTPGNGIKENGNFIKNGEDTINLNTLIADHNFVEFFNIPLVAGNYLPEYNYSKGWEIEHFGKGKAPAPGIDYYLVNRKALEVLGFKNPNDALGTRLKSSRGDLFSDSKIVGVVEDFHFGPIYEKEVPLLIMQRSWLPSTIIIRYQQNQEQTVIKLVKQQWNQQMPNNQLKYTFMTDVYKNIYRNEKQSFHLILIISMLSISLSILGLISITAYITNLRTKEIGIRRMNGAFATEILFMLNKNIIKWVAIAFIIASPIVWYAMTQWLQNFAYRTELSWWIFFLAGFIVLSISLLTVTWLSWQTASRNPIEALRYE
jgi:putative ABC transport system permease protein